MAALSVCAYARVMLARRGQTEERLYLLDPWRDSSLYTPRERAALVWNRGRDPPRADAGPGLRFRRCLGAVRQRANREADALNHDDQRLEPDRHRVPNSSSIERFRQQNLRQTSAFRRGVETGAGFASASTFFPPAIGSSSSRWPSTLGLVFLALGGFAVVGFSAAFSPLSRISGREALRRRTFEAGRRAHPSGGPRPRT